PTSRTMRASAAISFADSMRQTAAMVRFRSVAVMATDQNIMNASRQVLEELRRFFPHAFFLIHDLIRHAFAVAGDFKKPSRALDRRFVRCELEHREPADHFLGFGIRSVDDRALAVRAA